MENEQTFLDEGVIEGADADEASYLDDTDTSEEDVKPNDFDFLSKVKEITGREFKDEADFTKHYKNLNSFVGKKVDKPKEVKTPASTDRVAELEFKVDHPELKEHFDIIKMVAKERGISYNEAISDTMVKELLEVRQSKKGESVIHSNNKISSANSANIAKAKANIHTEDGLTNYLSSVLED